MTCNCLNCQTPKWIVRHPRIRSLLTLLTIVVVLYTALYVWPTEWRYDHLGRTPVRWNRVSGQMQFLTLEGWVDEIRLQPHKP